LPECGQPAVACIGHGHAKALRTPEFFVHVDHGRAYLHWMDWHESAPEDVKI
jgi:hypothetical protein